MDECNDLRREIFSILVTKHSIAMNLTPLHPNVTRLLNSYSFQSHKDCTKLDLIKYVYWSLISMKENIQIEPFTISKNTFVMKHVRAGTAVTILLEFQLQTIFNVVDVQLITKSRIASIIIELDRIPEPELFDDELVRVKLISDSLTSINNVFSKNILDKLDAGKSITPSRTSSAGSTGSCSPGCVYLG